MRLIDAGHLYDEVEKLKESPWFNDDTNGARIIRREALNIVEDLCICKEPTVCDIEQIRAEIEQIEPYDLPWDKRTPEHIRDMALEIIDKYAEQEPTSPCDLTREEALQILDTIPTIGEQVDALEMAIQALEQEPCDDAISREDAIHAFDYLMGLNRAQIQDILFKLPSVRPQETVTEFADRCRECGAKYGKLLKSKTGHWIRQDNTKEPLYGWYFCSECKSVIGDKTKFCSNCGARMVEPRERSDKE